MCVIFVSAISDKVLLSHTLKLIIQPSVVSCVVLASNIFHPCATLLSPFFCFTWHYLEAQVFLLYKLQILSYLNILQ